MYAADSASDSMPVSMWIANAEHAHRGDRNMAGHNAESQVIDLTRPRSSGRLVNPHVVPHKRAPEPDYARMRDLAHQRPVEENGREQGEG